jgi:hypothetical protein
MKTFNQVLTKRLEANGMFESQAEQVMKNYWTSDLASSGDLSDKPTINYPEQIENLVWAGVRIVALKYINEHCPKAWFKPVFEDKDPLHAQFRKEQQ